MTVAYALNITLTFWYILPYDFHAFISVRTTLLMPESHSVPCMEQYISTQNKQQLKSTFKATVHQVKSGLLLSFKFVDAVVVVVYYWEEIIISMHHAARQCVEEFPFYLKEKNL